MPDVDFDAIQEHRRARLKALIDDPEFGGNLSALGRTLGYKDGVYVRQMRDGDRPVSEKTVAKIHSLPKRSGWFSGEPAAEPVEGSDTDWAMFDAFKDMSDDDRDELLKVALARAERHRKLTAEVLRKAAGQDVDPRAFQPTKPVPGKAGNRYIRNRPPAKAPSRKRAPKDTT